MNKHLPKIIIETISHNKNRYDTVGDYYKIGKDWRITSSKMTADMEFCVIIHELVEWYLTQKRGIKEKDITSFDIQFEKNRKKCNLDEPGDDKRAPYYNEHQIATLFEKEMARFLKVNWKKYTNTVNKL